MTNEIKEILYKLKNIHNFDYSETCDNENNIIEKEYDIYLSKKDTDLLLDYITNLQEENKEWEYIQDIQNNRKYRKRYLEERRKEETNLYLPDYDEVYKRFFEQRDRINKAIEMFDNEKLNNYYSGMSYEFEIDDFKKDLLNILRGDE